MMNDFSEYADIVPYKSIGNIELGSNIDDVIKAVINQGLSVKHMVEPRFNPRSGIYHIENYLSISYEVLSRRIDRLFANNDYKGRLDDKIYMGMSLDELKKADDSLLFFELDDDYISEKYGYIIRMEIDNGYKQLNVLEITSENKMPRYKIVGCGLAEYY